MSFRNALDQAGLVIPAGILLALLWVVLVGVGVSQTMLPYGADAGVGQWVGQTWIAGFVGLCVLAVFAGALLYLTGELGEAEPRPEAFPPEE